jgi:K+-transporting ATPase ATPase B chain
VIEGIASADESAGTENQHQIRESGGDRCAVTGGTSTSDRIKIKVTSEPGFTFLDRMIALVEGAKPENT